MALAFFPLALFGWGGADAGAAVGLCGPGGGRDSTAIGCTGVSTAWGMAGWAGGSRYHNGIPNIRLGRLKVAMTSFLMTLGRGKRKGIVWTRDEST